MELPIGWRMMAPGQFAELAFFLFILRHSRLYVFGHCSAPSLVTFSLYVNIFPSPFDQGLAGVSLLDRHCRGKTSFSTRLDR
jgi:hypothetical protein